MSSVSSPAASLRRPRIPLFSAKSGLDETKRKHIEKNDMIRCLIFFSFRCPVRRGGGGRELRKPRKTGVCFVIPLSITYTDTVHVYIYDIVPPAICERTMCHHDLSTLQDLMVCVHLNSDPQLDPQVVRNVWTQYNLTC